MTNPAKIHHVKYQTEAEKAVEELLHEHKDVIKKLEKEKSVERVKCGSIDCREKLSLWKSIVLFFKKIFKR